MIKTSHLFNSKVEHYRTLMNYVILWLDCEQVIILQETYDLNLLCTQITYTIKNADKSAYKV